MLKKSLNYSGYILLESLFSLVLICTIINVYFTLNNFLLKKNEEVMEEHKMIRMLYEEMRAYENFGGFIKKEIENRGKTFNIIFMENKEKSVIGAEISGEKINFSIQRKE